MATPPLVVSLCRFNGFVSRKPARPRPIGEQIVLGLAQELLFVMRLAPDIDYQTELRYTFIELRIVLLGAEVAE
jgi:hypothetical protein